MKCDKLQSYKGDVTIPVYGTIADADVYLKEDADKAIAELQSENAELKKKLMPCLNGDCILTCEVVEKYGKENAELKAKLEDAKATAYAESVDAGMRERRLKRALWLARAERAKERKYKYETWERNELKKFNRDGDLIAIVSMKARKWRRVEIKCIKKAEEYK